MVFTATFNNISVISWLSVLLYQTHCKARLTIDMTYTKPCIPDWTAYTLPTNTLHRNIYSQNKSVPHNSTSNLQSMQTNHKVLPYNKRKQTRTILHLVYSNPNMSHRLTIVGTGASLLIA
jgi:hypothetical protein